MPPKRVSLHQACRGRLDSNDSDYLFLQRLTLKTPAMAGVLSVNLCRHRSVLQVNPTCPPTDRQHAQGPTCPPGLYQPSSCPNVPRCTITGPRATASSHLHIFLQCQQHATYHETSNKQFCSIKCRGAQAAGKTLRIMHCCTPSAYSAACIRGS